MQLETRTVKQGKAHKTIMGEDKGSLRGVHEQSRPHNSIYSRSKLRKREEFLTSFHLCLHPQVTLSSQASQLAFLRQ